MDDFVDKRDFELLKQDKCPYFILRRLLEGEFDWVLTDHARLIICKSDSHHPIWIWTADDASLGVIEWAYREIARHDLLRWYRFNVKYPVLQYFKERSAAFGRSIRIHTNLLAYECPELITPSEMAAGTLHRCNAEDIDTLAAMMKEFHAETRADERRDYRPEAEAALAAGNVFFWQDRHGKSVSCCKYTVAGDMASISLVYTRPEFRRRHYARTLVYEVTKLAAEAGYHPMLYADADYDPANSCYEKLGYVVRGNLYTISEI